MSVLPATPANLLDLQMQYAQYGVSTQENLGIPSNFVPVVDTWFTFYLSGNQDVYGNYRGYSGVASADFDMQIDVDPTGGYDLLRLTYTKRCVFQEIPVCERPIRIHKLWFGDWLEQRSYEPVDRIC